MRSLTACAAFLLSVAAVAHAQSPSQGDTPASAPDADPAAADAEVAPTPVAPVCSPAARACQADCPAGEISSRSGLCVPRALPPAESPDNAYDYSPGRWSRADAQGAPPEPEPDPTTVAQFAVLTNPGDIIVLAVNGIVAIPFNLLFAMHPYVALDVYGAGFVGEASGFMFLGGPRFTPEGRNLAGFYISPRGGYLTQDNLSGGTGALQVGYTWFFGHFVFSLGGGVMYVGGDAKKVAPIIDLSLGVGL